MLVLAARHGVQVDHGVEPGVRAGADRRVEALETFREQLERRGVVLEVALVDRQPDAVGAQVRERPRVLGREEGVEQAVEEALRPALPPARRRPPPASRSRSRDSR